jgi:hypothetical protein
MNDKIILGMENIIELVKYIGPLVGVFIGWLLSRKNESDKNKYSETRQIKRSLYVLLEIRNQLVVSKRLDKYLGKIVERLNAKIDSDIDDEIEFEQFKDLMYKILPSITGENYHKDLSEQFKKCIDNLSEINPFLAYRINGKQNIQDYLSSWENESKNYFQFNSIEEIQGAIDLFKPRIIDELKSDLETIMVDVAKLVGSKEVLKVKKTMSEPEEKEIDKDVEEWIDRVYEGIL